MESVMVGQSNQVKGKAAQRLMIQEHGHGLLNILLKNLARRSMPVCCSMTARAGIFDASRADGIGTILKPLSFYVKSISSYIGEK
jgi:hypothetical protein